MDTVSQLSEHLHNTTSLSLSQLPCEVDTADYNYTVPIYQAFTMHCALRLEFSYVLSFKLT